MIANYFPENGKFFYFWKGRVAFYAILKALEVGPGDEIIMPGFTCVVVPNVVHYLGATPIYADIEANTYNLTIETIEPLINKQTRVIVAQNTFGLSADLDQIMALAKRHNITVVEDCAHGLGGFYRGKPNGTVAHAAFFSTQWSKPISTGLGGVAYTEDNAIAHGLERVVAEMAKPGFGQQAILAAQLLARPLADNHILHYPLINTYRFLTQRLGLSVGSSSGDELEDVEMPPDYAQRMGGLQHHMWHQGLSQLKLKVKQRQKVAAGYDDFFTSTNIAPPCRPDYAQHAMLRYPIRVPNKEIILQKARQKRFPVGDWFISPLHPITGDLSLWGYRQGQCPVAEQACREVINLFTDHPLSRQQLTTLLVDS